MTTQVYAGVREILAGPDWEPVAVTDHGAFFTIAGMFKGTAHSGSRKDWRSLAADLDRIARELEARLAEELAEKVEAEPEPVIIPAEQFNAVVEAVAEAPPEPDPSELDALRARLAELEAENARLKTPAEPHNFPANMSDKLVDWVEPASEDLQQLMAGEETLAAAVERMTPGLDELLDMASALSEPSFEQAIVTIPVEKRNTWTERLFDERARLRLKRNTDEENLDRENLISRVATVFTKVGSKR